MKTSYFPGFLMIFIAFTLGSCKQGHETLSLKLEIGQGSPPVLHGIKALKTLGDKGLVQFTKSHADYTVHTTMDSVQYGPEAFSIQVDGDMVQLEAGNDVGLMYGLQDIKEQLESGHKTIVGKREKPKLAFRAIKFNLPWDPYRQGEATTLHYETCRDTVFWKSFLDMMAENRFNALTLWNLHPFNYLVKTAKYPEACSFTDAEMKAWETFWHTLFRMAKDRGIETYLVNWNIFVPKEFAIKHDVAKRLQNDRNSGGDGDTSEIIKDYMRECVRTTIDTYPNLTGLGITLGEGMGGMTAEERERWLLDSFIAGARQAKRKIKFIHRVPLSAGKGSGGSTSVPVEEMTRKTLDTLTCFDGPIKTELKFNWSHGHSSTKLVKVHGGKITDTYWNPPPTNYKIDWMIRNEDFFVLRWGQPDFIREHIARNAHPYVDGYYVGSECYIPAKDYITSLRGASYKYAFERQWMFYKCWGRLSYDPKTPDAVFEQAFEQRFEGLGKTLFSAQTKVSKVSLVIASFFNATWDYTLYSEGMLGFNDNEPPSVKLLSLKTMTTRDPMEPGYMSVREFLSNNEQDIPGKTMPFELAGSVEAFCSQGLEEVKNIEPGKNIDLLYEVSDIKAWAYLGLYFSNKLRAAVEYQQYIDSGNKEHHEKAVQWLEKATQDWHKLVEVTTRVYDPMPLLHYAYKRDDGYFHWSKIEKDVDAELDWLKRLK